MSETKEDQIQNAAGEVRPINTPRVMTIEDAQGILLDGGTPDDLRHILWEQMRGLIQQWVADNFSVAGYGGMDLESPPVAGPDLGAVYTPLTQYDTLSIATPRGCSLDTTTGQFSFTIQGVWQLSVTLSFEHNEVNAGRETKLRIYDVTAGAPIGSGIIIPTGRNSPATGFSATVLVEVDPTAVGNQFRLELGDGDAYSTVFWNSQNLSLVLVSEYRDAV